MYSPRNPRNPADQCRNRRKALEPAPGGFTLMELLLVMTVMGVLMSLMVPVYVSTIAESRTGTNALNFSNSVKLARSNAIRHTTRFTVCARSTDVKCGDDWNQGWLIVDNPGGANIAANGTVTDHDTNIIRVATVSDSISIPDTPASTVSSISFDAEGARLTKANWPESPDGTSDTFSFVDDNATYYVVGVRISPSGQVTLIEL